MKVFPGPLCFITLFGSSTCSCDWRHDCCSIDFEVNSRMEMKVFPGSPCFIALFGSSTCSCDWRYDCCSIDFEANSRIEMKVFPGSPCFIALFGSSTDMVRTNICTAPAAPVTRTPLRIHRPPRWHPFWAPLWMKAGQDEGRMKAGMMKAG